MAGCRIVNQSVIDAVSSINTISNSYKTAGDNLVKDLNNAIASMEGEAKDALKKFIDNDVNTFVVTDLPTAITGMANLLEANRTNFVETDSKLASSISGS